MPSSGVAVSPCLWTAGYALSSNHPLSRDPLSDGGESAETTGTGRAQCGRKAPWTVLSPWSEPQPGARGPVAPSCGLHPVSRAFPGRVAAHPQGGGPVGVFPQSPLQAPGSLWVLDVFQFSH